MKIDFNNFDIRDERKLSDLIFNGGIELAGNIIKIDERNERHITVYFN